MFKLIKASQIYLSIKKTSSHEEKVEVMEVAAGKEELFCMHMDTLIPLQRLNGTQMFFPFTSL